MRSFAAASPKGLPHSQNHEGPWLPRTHSSSIQRVGRTSGAGRICGEISPTRSFRSCCAHTSRCGPKSRGCLSANSVIGSERQCIWFPRGELGPPTSGDPTSAPTAIRRISATHGADICAKARPSPSDTSRARIRSDHRSPGSGADSAPAPRSSPAPGHARA